LPGKKPEIEIEYKSVVKEEGNILAIKQIYEVFETEDSMWEVWAVFQKSGLKLKPGFSGLDAKLKFQLKN